MRDKKPSELSEASKLYEQIRGDLISDGNNTPTPSYSSICEHLGEVCCKLKIEFDQVAALLLMSKMLWVFGQQQDAFYSTKRSLIKRLKAFSYFSNITKLL